jgi:hypothetical protein|tara:strand:- start:997 stop:1317 length:321 start_codon:yes stop_codon:yes gene_type:complete
MDNEDTLYCTSCGVANGDYTIVKRTKRCKAGLCKGIVLHPLEIIDVFNDLNLAGRIPNHFLFKTEESPSGEQLDFSKDGISEDEFEQCAAALDAHRDMLKDRDYGE